MVVTSCFKDLEGGVGLKRVREYVPEVGEKRSEGEQRVLILAV